MGDGFLEDKNWSDDRGANGLIWWEGLHDSDPTVRYFLLSPRSVLAAPVPHAP
jgi:1,4-alpha-glucan branching enzyme